MCPAPICPFGGNIAMLQSFNCANRVGGSQRQCQTWNCVIINFSGLSIFHSDWQNLYFLAYYWQFSFQKLVFWSLNVFFLIIGDFSKKTAQTVTLLEKSGIVWSHTGLETIQRRNCKGLWKRNNGYVLHNQNSHYLNKKNCTVDILHTPLLCFLLMFVLKESFVCFIKRFCLCMQPSLRELSHPPL